ncbi:MAG: hypothetical protein BWK78_03570 [Thiotrichaceae bacterium IS1]|nr:MAG: hypothetical protein BWK78_03570 [Thiotrichaceae bacterium IS1]
MELIINNRSYAVNQPFDKGGEAEIYQLNDDFAAKVYHSHILTDERKQKVLALCTAYDTNISQFGQTAFAFPQFPAYTDRTDIDHLNGFSMSYFKGCPPLTEGFYDLTAFEFRSKASYQFDDKSAINFIYDIFEHAYRLHKAKIVLGDINSKNILCNFHSARPQPIFVDLDAAQIAEFDCTAVYTEDYLDPLVEKQGKKPNGSYFYSSESDIFSLACLCYQFFVGAHPFYMRSHPPHPKEENMSEGISILRYLKEPEYFATKGIEYFSHPENQIKEERLKILERLDPGLFNFFVAVFVKNERTNLIFSLPSQDPRNPRSLFLKECGIEKSLGEIKYKQRQEKQKRLEAKATKFYVPKSDIQKVVRPRKPQADPPELTLFLKQYGIDYSQLLKGNVV